MPEREKRVLVVDDDDAIRTLLFTILRKRRFAVDVASNGEEAMARLDLCSYAVLLLDLMMPVMSGWEVLERLERRHARDRPLVIVLTAGSEPRSMNPAVVSGLIRKPFDAELLMDMVTGCLAVAEAREQRAECPAPQSSERERAPRGIN